MIQSMKGVETYLSKLYAVHRTAPEERLAVVRDALSQLGDPQNTIPAVHIAGTSGKGSTAYYVAAMLQSAGYSVGLAVSPHVNTVRERSQVNGAPLPAVEYLAYFNEFVAIVESRGFSFSYIEFLVVFTYWLFAKLELEYMVIEVGLGGRLDPTNTMTRSETIRVITDIGLDHTEILGDTLAEIAREKAGVIHEGDVVVMHRQSDEVMDVVGGATRLTPLSDTLPGSPLPHFQQRNWTLAERAVRARLEADGRSLLSADESAESKALVIPGRFEQLRYANVDIILDAAHNIQKIAALTAAVDEYAENRKVLYVVALGENKASQLSGILKCIGRLAEHVTFTRFSGAGDRAAIAPDELVKAAQEYIRTERLSHYDDPYEAVEGAMRRAQDVDGVVVVTGSFYLIDGVRRRLLG